MPRIVITSGPTREAIDPVRFLSNRSSGQMGAALARACLDERCEVVVVSGPVSVAYPPQADIIWVESTEEMFQATRAAFEQADGLIGAAAPCDFKPRRVAQEKISKRDMGLNLVLEPTIDILQTLSLGKAHRWIAGFALETHDHERHAIEKLRRKGCDFMILNDADVLGNSMTSIRMFDLSATICLTASGSKAEVALAIVRYLLPLGSNRPDSPLHPGKPTDPSA